MIKVSVITVCRNNQSTIADAMRSFLSQDYPCKEHVVIDGASTDNTLEIVKQFSPEILVSEPDDGMYYAVNKGIALASGDVVALLHADDVFASDNVISQMVKSMGNASSDTAYADLVYVDGNNPDKIVRYWQSGVFTKKKLSYGWMPPHPTFFVKRSVYQQFGVFDTSFKIAADYDIMLRFLSGGVSTVYCPIVAVKMRTGGLSNGSFGNILRKMREDITAARKNSVGGVFTITFKNLRKIKQLFYKTVIQSKPTTKQ